MHPVIIFCCCDGETSWTKLAYGRRLCVHGSRWMSPSWQGGIFVGSHGSRRRKLSAYIFTCTREAEGRNYKQHVAFHFSSSLWWRPFSSKAAPSAPPFKAPPMGIECTDSTYHSHWNHLNLLNAKLWLYLLILLICLSSFLLTMLVLLKSSYFYSRILLSGWLNMCRWSPNLRWLNLGIFDIKGVKGMHI